MASAEGLECPVCCELFDDQNICPRMLSCGHSFCTTCLERLLIADNKIPCPTCRVEVDVPQSGVEGLPKNFALLSIVNGRPQHTQHEEGKGLFICEVCDDMHLPTFWCFNCKEDLCKDAARFHSRSTATRDHQLISLESAAVTDFCPEHKEPFRLFDKACGQVVCRGCIKLNHKSHNCLSLTEAASKCRQEMQELATKVSDRSEVIKDAEARVMKASLDMKKTHEELGAQIHKLFKKIHAAITVREQILTNELGQLYNNKAAILTKQQGRLHSFQEIIVSAVQGVLSRIQSSGNAELLVARSAIESTLRDIEKQPMLIEPEAHFVPKLTFDRERLKNLLAALNKEVSVTENNTCAENTIAEGEGLVEAYSGSEESFTIFAHNDQKQRRTLGGDLFMVELTDKFGDKKATGNVEDRGDGSYLVTYTVPEDAETGYYKLNVRLLGAHIQGSPFTVHLYFLL